MAVRKGKVPSRSHKLPIKKAKVTRVAKPKQKSLPIKKAQVTKASPVKKALTKVEAPPVKKVRVTKVEAPPVKKARVSEVEASLVEQVQIKKQSRIQTAEGWKRGQLKKLKSLKG